MDDDDRYKTPASYRMDGIGPGAIALVEASRGLINWFVARQRQAYSLSIVQIHTAELLSPGLDIRYQNQFGNEIITLTAHPPKTLTTPQPAQPRQRVAQVPGVRPPLLSPPIPVTCLLVLYNGPDGDCDFAVFDMATLNPQSLSPPLDPNNFFEPLPNLFCAGIKTTTWGGQHIRVHQEAFGPIEAILTPINFTSGGEAATTLVLYSTPLAGGSTTATEQAHVPIMNGKESTIWTALDVFDISGTITRTGPGGLNVLEPDLTSLMPYCISPDGDYYYAPSWVPSPALITVGLDPITYPQAAPTLPHTSPFKNFYGIQYGNAEAVPPASTAPDAIATLENSLTPTGPAAAPQEIIYTYPEACVKELYSSDGSSAAFDMYVIPVLGGTPPVTTPQLQTVQNNVGFGTVATSPANGAPSLPTNTTAYVGLWYLDWKQTYVLAPGTGGDIGGQLPWPQYQIPTPGQSQDSLPAAMVPVSLVVLETFVAPIVTASAPALAENWSTVAAWLADAADWASPNPVNSNWLVFGTNDMYDSGTGVGETAPQDITSDGEGGPLIDLAAWWDVSNGENPSHIPTPAGVYSGAASWLPSGSYFNGFATAPVSDFPGITSVPDIAPVLHTSGTVSGTSYNGATEELPGCPLIYTYSNVDEINGTLSADETLKIFDFSGELDLSATYLVAVNLHPFPPSLSQVPTGALGSDPDFYSVSTLNYSEVVTALEIHTPYGIFTGTTASSFDPWLHVSNGMHYAQGFYVDKTPYLYLDGVDFMPALTKALRCQPTDIRALFMDIPYGVAQGICNVTVKPPAAVT
jgi:hypothetical protein